MQGLWGCKTAWDELAGRANVVVASPVRYASSAPPPPAQSARTAHPGVSRVLRCTSQHTQSAACRGPSSLQDFSALQSLRSTMACVLRARLSPVSCEGAASAAWPLSLANTLTRALRPPPGPPFSTAPLSPPLRSARSSAARLKWATTGARVRAEVLQGHCAACSLCVVAQGAPALSRSASHSHHTLCNPPPARARAQLVRPGHGAE